MRRSKKKPIPQPLPEPVSQKPPYRDYLKEMKSKREQQENLGGGFRQHMIHGAEIDKVLKSQNMSDAEKYNMLRIKTDQLE